MVEWMERLAGRAEPEVEAPEASEAEVPETEASGAPAEAEAPEAPATAE